MKVQASIWDVLTRLVVASVLVLASALVVAGVYFWYLPLIETNRRYRQEILSLDAKIEAEEKLARQYREGLEALQNDPRTVERRMRELGYARTNETVIRFEPANQR